MKLKVIQEINFSQGTLILCIGVDSSEVTYILSVAKFQQFYQCCLSRYMPLFILELLVHILCYYLILSNDVFVYLK